jgi:ABC-type multidrug transport system ATPase subunit
LTAAENLHFARALYGLRGGEVRSALEAVGLDEVADVRAGDFSQGMRQRLALARCRMRDPELLLLDEPYAGLDADARIVVEDLLRDARARGRTVLLASHEPPSPQLIDRSIVLEAGRLITGSVVGKS